MADFTYDLRDIKFVLNECLDMEAIFKLDRFKENYEASDMDPILNEAYKVVKNVIFPINGEGDKIGVKMEDGIVKLTPGYAEAYKFLQTNGWGSSNESLGSETMMPLTLYKAYNEMMMAACPALLSYVKLTSGAANLIYKFGTDKDREKFMDKMLEGEWSGTMCITEPNAGSEVGNTSTRAFPTDDPRIYKIKGSKMFITGGEVDMTENIIHMVLARPEGGAPGSKGIGLYIVPKIWVNDDGSLGEPNDVTCISVEHKMGMKGSATAMLNFGENDGCRGILMGEPADSSGASNGLGMMFHMMNESRIGTGHNALSQMAGAYYFAAKYANERIQGFPFTDRKSGQVPIIKHEDVRRMLMEMKAQVEGVRAMILKSFYYIDMSEHSDDKEKAARYKGLAEIMTPLIKAYASETAWPMVGQAIQVYGGVGYTEEYPVSQYARDVKVLSIWEGTSFIHSMDLVNRKMRMKGGAPFAEWMKDRKEFLDKNKGASGLEKEINNLEKAYACVDDINKLYASYYENMAEKGELIPLYALKVLTCVAQLFVAEALLEQALIAKKKMDENGPDHFDNLFYKGKVASAKFFANNILPNVYMQTDLIKNADRSTLECSEEVFLTT